MANSDWLVEIEGEELTDERRWIAALVNRLGGNVEISNKELENITSLVVDSNNGGATLIFKSE